MRRFAYRLALQLGWVNVDHMLRTITAEQFQEWMVFEALEPFETERGDVRNAAVVSTLINLKRKRGKKPISLDACKLRFGDSQPVAKERTQTWEQQKAIAQMYTGMKE
jgi:hypothetical protein